MFEGKAGAYPSEATSSAPLYGGLLASPTNIGRGWKRLTGTNTLAYCVVRFIVEALWPIL